MICKVRTYRDLLTALQGAPPHVLDQRVQVCPPNPDGSKATELMPAIVLASLGSLEYDATRSSVDNQHHPEQWVLLADYNPFDEDGSVAEDLLTGERLFPKP